MYNALSRQLADGATLIVDDRLAAVQLEALLAGQTDAPARAAWASPRILPHSAWAAELWASLRSDDRLLLSGPQSETLWRELITRTPDTELVHVDRVVDWAMDAWRRLLQWRIDVRELRALDEDPGFGRFLTWASAYQERLREGGWIDEAGLDNALCRSLDRLPVPLRLLWTDCHDPNPAREALIAALAAAGHTAAQWEPPARAGAAHTVAVSDSREEIAAAVRWAQDMLAEDACARVALVLPAGPERDACIARVVAAGLAEQRISASRAWPVSLDGRDADTDPVIGAALDCLRLFAPEAEFHVLSRVLRSPYFSEGLAGSAELSVVEASLRTSTAAQLPLVAAYRDADLRHTLAREAPRIVRLLDTWLDRIGRGPRLQSPTRWMHSVQELLTDAGWPGGERAVSASTLDMWSRISTQVAELTPVVGTFDYRALLAALRAASRRNRFPVAMPVAGITVLSSPEDVGFGYDGIWVSGMTDRVWPRPRRVNPLLPARLQLAHRMPYATPADALERCRQITARLVARASTVVFSYPLVEDDNPASMSPLLTGFTRRAEPLTTHPRYAHNRSADVIEEIVDPVPPLAGQVIPGGATTLALQARCPLRAFIKSRLGAEPLERIVTGITARERGILTHRFVELLLAGVNDRAELAALSSGQWDQRLSAAIAAVLRSRRVGRGGAGAVFNRLEGARLAGLGRELLQLELGRQEFAIEGLEVRHDATLAGFQIRCRIDRIDRLADGRLAIIDYKTGSGASPRDWLRPRLIEPQLPIYSQLVQHTVGALAFGVLQPGEVAYKGLTDTPAAFSGRGMQQPPVDWDRQQAQWGEQLAELVLEFAAGDARVFVDDYEEAAGAFAPLTRIYETLAEYRRVHGEEGASD
jgi:ATP-dependent helicase/nuclease subunit B